MRAIVAMCVLVAVPAAACFALEQGQKAPTFKLVDQFGKTWDLSQMKGDVVVLVVADRDSGRLMEPWYARLKEKYGSEITLLGLLDLHTVPGIGRGIAKARIRSETKDPMAIDWHGDVAKSYDVSGKHPVVVVIDKEGIVRCEAATTCTDAAFKTTAAAIDKALKA